MHSALVLVLDTGQVHHVTLETMAAAVKRASMGASPGTLKQALGQRSNSRS
jgi:hypothetical protein